MTDGAINKHRIADIFNRLLLGLPANERKRLPPIISKPDTSVFTFQTDAYLIISLVEPKEKRRLTKLSEKGISPFPELVKPYFIPASSAFAIEKSKNVLIENCTVQRIFSLSLGKDCTVILLNHKQGVAEKKVGVSEYFIELAFVFSYGDEINTENVYDFIEDLVKYFVKRSAVPSSKE